MEIFNGANQGTPVRCGANATLILSHSHFFYLNLGVWLETNIRDEIITIWSLLYFSKSQGITKFQIVGDSNVTIDRNNGVVTNLNYSF